MAFVIDRTLEIDAPAAVVWEVVSDLARYPEWNPFCIECHSTLQPGDPIDMTVKLMAKPQQQREWMLEFVDGKRFAYRMTPLRLCALSSYRAHDVNPVAAARCRYHSYFHLKGWFSGVVTTLLGRRLVKGFEGMNAAVKQRSETLWAERSKTPMR